MSIINRNNLTIFSNEKDNLKMKISIICRKINIRLIVRISKPYNIFNDIFHHLNDKKIINSIKVYAFIYKKLKQVYNDLKHERCYMSNLQNVLMIIFRKY